MSRAATVRRWLASSLAAAAAASAAAQPSESVAGRALAGAGMAATLPAASRDGAMNVTVPLRAAGADATGIDLALKFRARAAALERGLGTSGTDYAAEVKFVRPFGSWSAFGRFGYHGSDAPLRSAYSEPWRAELGGAYQFAGGHEAGAAVEYRQPNGAWAPVRELSAFSALRVGDWRYQLSLTHSLAQGTPDMSVGVSVRRRF